MPSWPLSTYSHRAYSTRPSAIIDGENSLTALLVSFSIFLPSPSIR